MQFELRDVRIGAVVDVEQRALRAFEQQRLAARARRAGAARRRRRPSARSAARARASRRASSRSRTGGACSSCVSTKLWKSSSALELLGEAVGIEQVLHAQRAARDLVLVRRADAAAGGADLRRRPSTLRAPGRAPRGYGSTSGHAGEMLQPRSAPRRRPPRARRSPAAAPPATARRRCRCSIATCGAGCPTGIRRSTVFCRR